jgi:DNA-binding CsgD family transcriptional regulator
MGTLKGQANQLARITLRQICSLELPAPVLLPAILKALREVVPADHAAFFFCDAGGNITNLYAEKMLSPALMADYDTKFFSAPEVSFQTAYKERLLATRPVSTHTLTEAEMTSEYYEQILSALNAHHFLYVIVRNGSVPVGQLSLYRSFDRKAFSVQDESAMLDVLHYLEIALRLPDVLQKKIDNLQASEESLAIIGIEGKVLFSDNAWSRMIRMAKGEPITPRSSDSELNSIAKFIKSVLAMIDSSPHSAYSCDSMWGHFKFKRHSVTEPDGSPAVALIISRVSPDSVLVAQGAAALGLSAQQREVALLIAAGATNAEIAAQLGITINTAGYHVKTVFARLNVNDRNAVARHLKKAAP